MAWWLKIVFLDFHNFFLSWTACLVPHKKWVMRFQKGVWYTLTPGETDLDNQLASRGVPPGVAGNGPLKDFDFWQDLFFLGPCQSQNPKFSQLFWKKVAKRQKISPLSLEILWFGKPVRDNQRSLSQWHIPLSVFAEKCSRALQLIFQFCNIVSKIIHKTSKILPCLTCW